MNLGIGKQVDVLLIEDNEGDIGLIKHAIRLSAARINLLVATSGVDGLKHLRASKPRPNLVILDLNIPGMSGYDVLREMKADAELEEIPVVVFTSSEAARDVRMAYRMHANSFVRKPTDLDEFVHTVSEMQKYWTTTACLPPA
jgi:two-component system, chemotaxis family, response regulator Rcp1